MVVVANLLFRHVKSTVSFHLTKAESQAATMVGVPQGYTLRSRCKSGRVDVVVDTVSRKA